MEHGLLRHAADLPGPQNRDSHGGATFEPTRKSAVAIDLDEATILRAIRAGSSERVQR